MVLHVSEGTGEGHLRGPKQEVGGMESGPSEATWGVMLIKANTKSTAVLSL